MATNDMQISPIPPEDIPDVINTQFDELSKLKKKVDHANKKADQAKDSADSAYCKSAGLFQKKEAIESLQTATRDLAESQSAMADAQETMFKYQEKIGTVMKSLFSLGVANIAANRTVVRELELRLRGASEEELDDLARNEIVNVVKQLKAQEDIMNKQSKLADKVRRLEAETAEAKETDEVLANQIQTQAHWIAGQNQKWKTSAQKEEQQDKEIKTIKQ